MSTDNPEYDAFLAEVTALEKRVGEKFAAAAAGRAPTWPVPEEREFYWPPPEHVRMTEPLLQFPREQWATYPNQRFHTLCVLSRLLDFNLDDAQWLQAGLLWHYGGKTRLS